MKGRCIHLKIVLSDEAITWFKEEMSVVSGDAIRFYAKYGGSSPLHDGFSLGVTKQQPDEAVVETTHDGVLFYIESQDEWFFTDYDLYVDIDTNLDELQFAYEKEVGT